MIQHNKPKTEEYEKWTNQWLEIKNKLKEPKQWDTSGKEEVIKQIEELTSNKLDKKSDIGILINEIKTTSFKDFTDKLEIFVSKKDVPQDRPAGDIEFKAFSLLWSIAIRKITKLEIDDIKNNQHKNNREELKNNINNLVGGKLNYRKNVGQYISQQLNKSKISFPVFIKTLIKYVESEKRIAKKTVNKNVKSSGKKNKKDKVISYGFFKADELKSDELKEDVPDCQKPPGTSEQEEWARKWVARISRRAIFEKKLPHSEIDRFRLEARNLFGLDDDILDIFCSAPGDKKKEIKTVEDYINCFNNLMILRLEQHKPSRSSRRRHEWETRNKELTPIMVGGLDEIRKKLKDIAEEKVELRYKKEHVNNNKPKKSYKTKLNQRKNLNKSKIDENSFKKFNRDIAEKYFDAQQGFDESDFMDGMYQKYPCLKINTINNFVRDAMKYEPPEPIAEEVLKELNVSNEVSKICDNLYLSGFVPAMNINMLVKDYKIAARVNFSELNFPEDEQEVIDNKLVQVNIHMDLLDKDYAWNLSGICAKIAELMLHGPVLVHCVEGRERSATAVIAMIIAITDCTIQEAYDHVRYFRPCVKIKTADRYWLEYWCSQRDAKILRSLLNKDAKLKAIEENAEKLKGVKKEEELQRVYAEAKHIQKQMSLFTKKVLPDMRNFLCEEELVQSRQFDTEISRRIIRKIEEIDIVDREYAPFENVLEVLKASVKEPEGGDEKVKNFDVEAVLNKVDDVVIKLYDIVRVTGKSEDRVPIGALGYVKEFRRGDRAVIFIAGLGGITEGPYEIDVKNLQKRQLYSPEFRNKIFVVLNKVAKGLANHYLKIFNQLSDFLKVNENLKFMDYCRVALKLINDVSGCVESFDSLTQLNNWKIINNNDDNKEEKKENKVEIKPLKRELFFLKNYDKIDERWLGKDNVRDSQVNLSTLMRDAGAMLESPLSDSIWHENSRTRGVEKLRKVDGKYTKSQGALYYPFIEGERRALHALSEKATECDILFSLERGGSFIGELIEKFCNQYLNIAVKHIRIPKPQNNDKGLHSKSMFKKVKDYIEEEKIKNKKLTIGFVETCVGGGSVKGVINDLSNFYSENYVDRNARNDIDITFVILVARETVKNLNLAGSDYLHSVDPVNYVNFKSGVKSLSRTLDKKTYPIIKVLSIYYAPFRYLLGEDVQYQIQRENEEILLKKKNNKKFGNHWDKPIWVFSIKRGSYYLRGDNAAAYVIYPNKKNDSARNIIMDLVLGGYHNEMQEFFESLNMKVFKDGGYRPYKTASNEYLFRMLRLSYYESRKAALDEIKKFLEEVKNKILLENKQRASYFPCSMLALYSLLYKVVNEYFVSEALFSAKYCNEVYSNFLVLKDAVNNWCHFLKERDDCMKIQNLNDQEIEKEVEKWENLIQKRRENNEILDQYTDTFSEKIVFRYYGDNLRKRVGRQYAIKIFKNSDNLGLLRCLSGKDDVKGIVGNTFKKNELSMPFSPGMLKLIKNKFKNIGAIQPLLLLDEYVFRMLSVHVNNQASRVCYVLFTPFHCALLTLKENVIAVNENNIIDMEQHIPRVRKNELDCPVDFASLLNSFPDKLKVNDKNMVMGMLLSMLGVLDNKENLGGYKYSDLLGLAERDQLNPETGFGLLIVLLALKYDINLPRKNKKKEIFSFKEQFEFLKDNYPENKKEELKEDDKGFDYSEYFGFKEIFKLIENIEKKEYTVEGYLTLYFSKDFTSKLKDFKLFLSYNGFFEGKAYGDRLQCFVDTVHQWMYGRDKHVSKEDEQTIRLMFNLPSGNNMVEVYPSVDNFRGGILGEIAHNLDVRIFLYQLEENGLVVQKGDPVGDENARSVYLLHYGSHFEPLWLAKEFAGVGFGLSIEIDSDKNLTISQEDKNKPDDMKSDESPKETKSPLEKLRKQVMKRLEREDVDVNSLNVEVDKIIDKIKEANVKDDILIEVLASQIGGDFIYFTIRKDNLEIDLDQAIERLKYSDE